MEKTKTKSFNELLTEEIEFLYDFLTQKNISYGNSALEPINIFSKASAIDQIDVRIDDKINRIKKGKEYATEDTELDLLGYLILKRIAKKTQKG